MRRMLFVALALGTLASLAAPRPADAFGLRLGGFSVVEDEKDSKFAIGLDNDINLASFLAINTASLFEVDGDSMYVDGYIGLKLIFPLGMGDKLKLAVRGNFLLKWFYPFQDAIKSGLAIGGVVGPSLIFQAGPVGLSFDVDVQIYNFVYPDAYDSRGTQVAIAYLLGLRF